MNPVCQRYLGRFGTRAPFARVWEHARFVVLDTESTGTDPRRDRLVSIGAVAVVRGQIELDDSFATVLPVSHNTSAVTLHGITREAAATGVPEEQAIGDFLDYIGDAILVGHHIGHDIILLDAACQRHHGCQILNERLDTLELTLRLAGAGAFAAATPTDDLRSLDSLCTFFGIVPHDRHTASGDAFLTAQILLRLLRKAHALDWLTVRELQAQAAD
jgi:DNA polymerase-3 subunit epsilon